MSNVSSVVRVGVDLAKDVFHAYAVDAHDLWCAIIELNARRRPIVLMVEATEYRFDA